MYCIIMKIIIFMCHMPYADMAVGCPVWSHSQGCVYCLRWRWCLYGKAAVVPIPLLAQRQWPSAASHGCGRLPTSLVWWPNINETPPRPIGTALYIQIPNSASLWQHYTLALSETRPARITQSSSLLSGIPIPKPSAAPKEGDGGDSIHSENVVVERLLMQGTSFGHLQTPAQLATLLDVHNGNTKDFLFRSILQVDLMSLFQCIVKFITYYIIGMQYVIAIIYVHISVYVMPHEIVL